MLQVWRPIAISTARALLVVVFLLAALAKLAEIDRFGEDLAAWSVVPDRLGFVLALVVVWTEIGLAAWLGLGPRRRTACLASAAMLAVFPAAVVIESRLSEDVQCNCFGELLEAQQWRSTLDMWLITNGMIIVAALVGAMPWPARSASRCSIP